MSFAGLIIELLVAGLLAVTIGYCALLNKRLKKMRADEDTMRSIIVELVKSTETAERAILGLRATASECNKTISARLSEAREVSASLDASVANGRHTAKQHPVQQMQTAAPRQQMPQPAAPMPQVDPHEAQRMAQMMRAEHARMQQQQMTPPPAMNDVPYQPVPQEQPALDTGFLNNDLEASLQEIARRNRMGAAA